MIPSSLEADVIRTEDWAWLRDVWREVHPGRSAGACIDQEEKRRLEGFGMGAARGPPCVKKSLGRHGQSSNDVRDRTIPAPPNRRARLNPPPFHPLPDPHLHLRARLLHFVASVFISLACFVAVWFSPANYVSFLLMLLSSLGLMGGAFWVE